MLADVKTNSKSLLVAFSLEDCKSLFARNGVCLGRSVLEKGSSFVHLLLASPMEEMLAEVNFSFSLLWQILTLKNFSPPGNVLHKLDEHSSTCTVTECNFLRTNVHLGSRFLYTAVNP